MNGGPEITRCKTVKLSPRAATSASARITTLAFHAPNRSCARKMMSPLPGNAGAVRISGTSGSQAKAMRDLGELQTSGALDGGRFDRDVNGRDVHSHDRRAKGAFGHRTSGIHGPNQQGRADCCDQQGNHNSEH